MLPPLEIEVSPGRGSDLEQVKLQGKWNSLFITRRGRRVVVNMVFEFVKEPQPRTGAIVGLNRGVVSTVATSDGAHIQGSLPDAKRCRRLQRQLSRAEKGSGKRKKKVAIYSNFRYRETLAKRNEILRITSRLVAVHDFNAIEDYKNQAMTRSGDGTVENPGKNVGLRAQLNRSVLEQNWGLVGQQIAYEAEWAGKQFLRVSPMYISQDCSSCRHRRAGPFSNRIFRCRYCGLALNQELMQPSTSCACARLRRERRPPVPTHRRVFNCWL